MKDMMWNYDTNYRDFCYSTDLTYLGLQMSVV